MSHTWKDKPQRFRKADAAGQGICPGCPWCGVGKEAKTQARQKRRSNDKHAIQAGLQTR